MAYMTQGSGLRVNRLGGQQFRGQGLRVWGQEIRL